MASTAPPNPRKSAAPNPAAAFASPTGTPKPYSTPCTSTCRSTWNRSSSKIVTQAPDDRILNTSSKNCHHRLQITRPHIRCHCWFNARKHSHSFVRRHWSRSAESTPMILAKSSHDASLLSWLADQPCQRTSRFGGITQIKIEVFTSLASKRPSAHQCRIRRANAFSF